jgi:hypothetical protein
MFFAGILIGKIGLFRFSNDADDFFENFCCLVPLIENNRLSKR